MIISLNFCGRPLVSTLPLKPYVLAIMFPDNHVDAMATFTADTPFTAIAAGDLINCEEERRLNGVPLLRAVRAEHQLYQGDNIGFRQVTRVYTEEATDDRASRFKR